MKTFTAKQLHDNPSEVYRAALKEQVTLTHKHFGKFTITHESVGISDDELISRTSDDVQKLFGSMGDKGA